MLRGLVFGALTACSFQPALGTNDANGGPSDGLKMDAPIVEIDGMIEDAPQVTCTDFAPRADPRHVDPCAAHPPGGAWVIGQLVGFYNTDNGDYLNGDNPESYEIGPLRVVSVSAFEIKNGATLRVFGSRPLVILSWSTIEIAGTLDVSSTRGDISVNGPGANAGGGDCVTAGTGASSSRSGGGGGGGFGANGGDGGDGRSGNPNNRGGTGGAAVAIPTTVRGGCPGGHGGTNPLTRGLAGSGGGAVQLTAKDSLTISGRVHAGGAGGDGGHGDGGGGGGGSGGYIGLDAASVNLTSSSLLAANGGGGGTGCSGLTGPDGENGQLSTSAADGGDAANCNDASAGADGSAQTVPEGQSAQQSDESAGGGGGGAGYIIVWGSPTNAGMQSPPLTQR